MSKEDYKIGIISKEDCASILLKWHYLKDISKGFKSGVNYGLFKNNRLCGVCIYTGFPVPELVKGMYGLERDDQMGFFELSRLCLEPDTQQEEHNLASWFVSKTIKSLRRNHIVRSILSYADNDHHKGTVYRACNFSYYGLTAKKKDFWLLQKDGSHIKHSRGKTKGVAGEWRDRSQKHRFVMVFDKRLHILWEKGI
tara:strand:- start:5 stop:595 length:591 start_codon:yes stop_codon:yes gene_type:complete